MDYILWSRIIVPLTIAIFVIYVVISSNSAYKKIEQKKLEANNEVDTSVNSEVVPSPFMENFGEFPSAAELVQETVESTDANMLMEGEQSDVVQETTPERKRIESPPIPVDSPMRLPTKPMPSTSLLDLTPKTFRQGIVLSEILGKPKGLRHK
jgi:hypothetical protein